MAGVFNPKSLITSFDKMPHAAAVREKYGQPTNVPLRLTIASMQRQVSQYQSFNENGEVDPRKYPLSKKLIGEGSSRRRVYLVDHEGNEYPAKITVELSPNTPFEQDRLHIHPSVMLASLVCYEPDGSENADVFVNMLVGETLFDYAWDAVPTGGLLNSSIFLTAFGSGFPGDTPWDSLYVLLPESGRLECGCLVESLQCLFDPVANSDNQ